MFTVEKVLIAIDIFANACFTALIITLIFVIIDKIFGQTANSYLYYIKSHQKFLLTYSLFYIIEQIIFESSGFGFFLLYLLFYIISSVVIDAIYMYLF